MGERTRSRIGTTEGVKTVRVCSANPKTVDGTKFSVVIPAYNVAPYLRECLDSVLAQDFENWECVVVDDESTDEGPQILDEYAAKDKRIHVIHQKNKGEGGARNSGLAEAKGEWIFFLDGDDKMARDALMHLNQLIEKNPEEKLIRFGYEQYQDGVNWAPQGVCPSVKRRDISNRILMDDFFAYMWRHLYRRDVVEGILFKGYKRGCDRVFIDEILLNRVDSFVETSAVLYGYRMRIGSAMNSVPSVRVITDEMCHRRDIVQMIENSEKSVEYAGSWWLEGYFTGQVGELIIRKESQDRKNLWDAWIGCIDDMCQAKGLSWSTRILYTLCSSIRCRTVWWFLCRIWLWYNSQNALARGVRKILRMMKMKNRRGNPMFHITEGRERGLNAFAKAPSDVATITERIGFVDAGLWSGWLGRMVLKINRDRVRRWFAMLKLRMPTQSVCLFQYPNFSMSDQSWANVLGKMRARGVKVIGLLHDIEDLRYSNAEVDGLRPATRAIFEQFDVIIVHNVSMRKWMSEQGFPEDRMVELGVFDYLTSGHDFASPEIGNKVIIAGNLNPNKAGYLSALPNISDIEWNLYGANYDEGRLKAGNIVYRGSYAPEELPSKLVGSFGLVWDGPSAETCSGPMGRYLRYNNPHKLSLYLRAGLPVIVWKDSAEADFVRRHDVGIMVGSLRELAEALRKVGGERYRGFVSNCRTLSMDLQCGVFAAKAMRDSLGKIGVVI